MLRYSQLLCALLVGSSQGLQVKKVVEKKSAAEVAQAGLCDGVRPQLVCMMKSYKWGLVWLHGLGNGKTSQAYENILVPQILALTGFPPGRGVSVFPQAPMINVTSDKVVEQAWHNQEMKKCDVEYKPPHHGYSLADGLKNVDIVHAGIRQLMDLGIPSNKIMVAGHSMGGSMTYLSAIRFPEKLMGAINLSGGMLGWWDIPHLKHPSGHNDEIPMLWMKGEDDDIVPVAHQDEIVPKLRESGFQPVLKTFQGGHDLTDPRIIGDVVGFINKQLINT